MGALLERMEPGEGGGDAELQRVLVPLSAMATGVRGRWGLAGGLPAVAAAGGCATGAGHPACALRPTWPLSTPNPVT